MQLHWQLASILVRGLQTLGHSHSHFSVLNLWLGDGQFGLTHLPVFAHLTSGAMQMQLPQLSWLLGHDGGIGAHFSHSGQMA